MPALFTPSNARYTGQFQLIIALPVGARVSEWHYGQPAGHFDYVSVYAAITAAVLHGLELASEGATRTFEMDVMQA